MQIVTFKTCSKCGMKKPLSEYYKQQQTNSGRMARCKKCMGKQHQEYRQSEKGKIVRKQYNDEYLRRKDTKIGMRAVGLRLKFNLTLDDYNQIFNNQKGCCAICGKHQSEFKNALSVDHNHKTGKVRGLLCVRCNTRLSFIENAELMAKTTAYLAEYATASQGEYDGR